MRFHYLARALIISGDFVLLAREVGAVNTFFPGGHIEVGESAEKALIRELEEETGHEANIISFLGAVEATWYKAEEPNCEINLIFNVELSGVDFETEIISKEDHTEFFWVKRSEVKSYNLLPETMNKLVVTDHSKINAFWGARTEK